MLPPPRPKLQTLRHEPSAPDLAGLFPTSAAPTDLRVASHNQAAFLWHYSEQQSSRLDGLEHGQAEHASALTALTTKLDKFVEDLIAKELER